MYFTPSENVNMFAGWAIIGFDCSDFILLCHRWKTQFGGEPRETKRETKCERAMHALSNGLMAGVCYVKLAGFLGCYNVNRMRSVLSMLLNVPILATACPSTWETKCLMFTKLLSRETTTTCLSDRALDCRDRLCSKPNSHSGKTVTPLLWWW